MIRLDAHTAKQICSFGLHKLKGTPFINLGIDVNRCKCYMTGYSKIRDLFQLFFPCYSGMDKLPEQDCSMFP